MIRLRITSAGLIRAMWTDAVEFTAIGHTRVRRASHVEFDEASQTWCVHAVGPRRRWRCGRRRAASRLRRRALFRATTRREALEWEARYFGPGGYGWPKDADSVAARCLIFLPLGAWRFIGAYELRRKQRRRP